MVLLLKNVKRLLILKKYGKYLGTHLVIEYLQTFYFHITTDKIRLMCLNLLLFNFVVLLNNV